MRTLLGIWHWGVQGRILKSLENLRRLEFPLSLDNSCGAAKVKARAAAGHGGVGCRIMAAGSKLSEKLSSVSWT